MESETLLIIGAIAIGGIAVYKLAAPVGESLNDVTGVVPFVQGQITSGESWLENQPWFNPLGKVWEALN